MKSFLLEMIYDAWQTKDRTLPIYKPSDLLNTPHVKLGRLYDLRSRPKQISDLKMEFRRMGYAGLNFLYEHIYVPEERNRTVVVADYASRLQWQQGGSEVPLIRESSEAYIRKMNDTEYAGHTRWRLPTLSEVLSMLGDGPPGTGFNPLFDPNVDTFWTSDSVAGWDGVIAVFIAGSGNTGLGDVKTLLSVEINGTQLNINLIGEHSNACAYVRAVRTLDSEIAPEPRWVIPRGG